MSECEHEKLDPSPGGTGVFCPACDRIWQVPKIGLLRAALLETTAEAIEHRRNIIEARTAGFQGIDGSKFRQAYDREVARFDALIGRAQTALSTTRRAP